MDASIKLSLRTLSNITCALFLLVITGCGGGGNDVDGRVDGSLIGPGVEPSWPGNWQELDQDTDYTEVDDVQFQYQLCMKCHSSYAFGTMPPPEPGGTPGYTSLTDQAKEFNPNNKSHHAIVEPGKNDFRYYNVEFGRDRDYSGSLIGGLTPGSTLTCTDCHSDSDLETEGAHGQSGSEYWPLLQEPWDATTGQDGTSHHLCFKCHKYEVYAYETGQSTSLFNPDVTGFSGCRDNLLDGPNETAMMQGGPCDQRYRGSHLTVPINLHISHNIFKDAPCMTCHMAVPHGSDKRALLVYGKNPYYIPTLFGGGALSGLADPGADPEPYNALARKKVWFPSVDDDQSNGGIPSRLDLDEVESGNWKRSYCHGYPGVGCNSVYATDPVDDPAFP
jgi:hypothetical protein